MSKTRVIRDCSLIRPLNSVLDHSVFPLDPMRQRSIGQEQSELVYNYGSKTRQTIETPTDAQRCDHRSQRPPRPSSSGMTHECACVRCSQLNRKDLMTREPFRRDPKSFQKCVNLLPRPVCGSPFQVETVLTRRYSYVLCATDAYVAQSVSRLKAKRSPLWNRSAEHLSCPHTRCSDSAMASGSTYILGLP